MYRQFKSGGQKNEQPQQASECSSPKEQNSDPPSDPEAERQVAACWDVIWHTCSQTPDGADGIPGLGHLQRRSADSQTQALGGWQTVRIFVSSTFVDFFSEREILVKKVFPELREWCQERKLKLVECDLRWGVPKDATSTQALLTCLEEIDRCYETNSQPFFLNMLGERYGWIPGKGEVPEEVREKYTWVEGTSMTFMEILHGVLRISNPNAAFFLRDSGFTSSIPESHISRFQSETSLARVHMKELKSQLANKFPRQMFSYSANYAGISEATGREQVNLDGLEDFADQVKVFFQAAIEKAYPFSSKADDIAPEQRETQLQWMFIQDKAETLIGRNNDLQLLQKYANGESDLPLEMIEGKNATIRKLEDWDVEEGDSRLCLVTAEGGWGKTALLAALAQQAI